MIKLETLKKKIIYRANYRGTKEMDILLSKFVDKYINTFSIEQLRWSCTPEISAGRRSPWTRTARATCGATTS